jgi:hypothetical protein
MNFSRHSCAAAARGTTPRAASSAFSARRCCTPAAIDTQNPVLASSSAAIATPSRACCGTSDSGSFSRPLASAVWLITALPPGRPAVRPGGTPPSLVASHHWVTGAGARARPVRKFCTLARSTTRALVPVALLAVTVGNDGTAATILMPTVAPSMTAWTVEPTAALFADR